METLLKKYDQQCLIENTDDYFQEATYFTSYEQLFHHIVKANENNNKELPAFNQML